MTLEQRLGTMRLRPGSASWLLRHEITLAVRNWRLQGRLLVICGAFAWLGLHVLAWLLLRVSHQPLASGMVMIVGGILTLVVISMMIAQGITLSVDALFVRGDLDLLLASPISPRTVFLVRSLGISLGSVAIYAFLLTPFADMGPFTGHPELLAIYPALAALALLTTAFAMLLTLALVRALGARRARVAAQVLGALIGASAFLASQAPNLFGSGVGGMTLAILRALWREDGLLGSASVMWWPFRALVGDMSMLSMFMVAGFLSFAFTVNFACAGFVAGTQDTVTGSRRKRGRAALTFRRGVTRNVLVKEWKLIARDPNLIAQTLMQVLYALPLAFLLFRREENGAALVPLFVLIASTLAGSLAWLTVAAEDAPELIGAAPVSITRLAWTKVAAAVIPVWLLVLPVLVLFARHRVFAAVVAALCMVAATLCTGAMQVWYPQRGKRSDLKRRARSSMVVAMLEFVTGAAWTAVAWTILTAPRYVLIAAPLALLAPGLVWHLGRVRREALLQ
ncbi:MAG: hypothetical protein M3Z31_00350 [Pseudomonadota bacterium]|nr:hypothetical protein [Pseudomonadota bacterium]